MNDHEVTPPAADPRVRFAAERTLLAWIRTGLGMMGFGFVVARFGLFLHELDAMRPAPAGHSVGGSLWIGIALVALGALFTAVAAVQHVGVVKRLNRGETYVASEWSLGFVLAAILSAVGTAMILYLLSTAL